MIPVSIAEVDPQWLSGVLDAPVEEFSLTQIGQGVGIMGDIYRADLVYKTPQPDRPSSVVIKLPSSFEENRAQGVALGMFESEVRFYNELARQAQVGMPAIYRAEIRSGSAEFVIVMEDLCDATLVSQSEGMGYTQALAAVRVLAEIHAVWWGQVQTPELEWIPAMVGPRIEFVDQMLPPIMPAFAEAFADRLSAQELEVFQAFVGNYLKINKVIAARSPWTLVHQDFRVENLLFDATDPARVTVIDWQGIGRGPGAYDLAYLLGGSMTETLRREHELALVTAYHEQLMRSGISGYSADACLEDYKLAHLMGGLATSILVGGGMDLSNERGVALATTMARRHAAAALDHDGLNRLAAIVG